MKYNQCIPIRTRQHSVWRVILPSGEERIEIWDKNATLEDVHRWCSANFPVFKIGQLGVGEFIVGKTVLSYMDDGRFVDQDWDVT